ncbi:hypothetical protein CDL12_15051 [Handroanthus impetiginosus]|uniref:Uncharacterized protein n=1 Tax=Handroanthus impetiginosus TaxID=429701 RepID=A0A2G9H495_9LAMI|nr:hypothetical protein CDL12_15051 [Handroanthus impetiginosus]
MNLKFCELLDMNYLLPTNDIQNRGFIDSAIDDDDDGESSDSKYGANDDNHSEGVALDFEYFAEGDKLSDTDDALGSDESFINANAYFIDNEDDSHAFCYAKNDVESDLDILDSPNESNHENMGLKFP